MTDGAFERGLHRGGAQLTAGTSALPTLPQRWLIKAAVGPIETVEDSLREWRKLVDLTGPLDGGSYRLIPMIFYRLQSADIDDPNRGMFKGVYRRSVVDNNRVMAAITPSLRSLADAGITPWLTKGAGLVSAGYYPTLATRPMSDVDLVVEREKRERAIEALLSTGFRPLLSEREMVPLHGAPFVDGSGTEVDLHWHFLEHARSTEADDVIARDSRIVDVNGVSVRVPGPTGLLITTMVHGMIPNPEPPVRWLVDAAQLIDRGGRAIVWDDVVEFARRFHFPRRVERALGLLAESTERAAPEPVVASLTTIPTSLTEKIERPLWDMPWNSLRGRALRVVAGYAGGDRELRRIVIGLPRYLAQRWNVDRIHRLPGAGARKLLSASGKGRR